jgi:hypothetical protein
MLGNLGGGQGIALTIRVESKKSVGQRKILDMDKKGWYQSRHGIVVLH